MNRLAALALFCLLTFPALAQEAEPPQASMTAARVLQLLTSLDEDARQVGSGIELTLADVPVLVILDPASNRMRAMVPIASADGLTEGDLARMMQANFDTALDARYAVARGRLWSVYIHPLAELQDAQLISGLAQTVTLAQTYGTLYSGGAQAFGGGDSGGLYRELLEDLLNRGEDI